MASIVRGLTAAELGQASRIFGADLHYRAVLIHNTKAYFFQPDDTAITPNGQIYFGPKPYKADFGLRATDCAFLIHELTHAWQHQKGMAVRLRGMLNRQYDYGDLTNTKRVLTDFSIEQQASIVEDYFRTTHGLRQARGRGSRADYERVIPFLPGRKQ